MATPTFIQQVSVENANTYWSYWYTNPTNWSNWDSPKITLSSTLTGDTPLKITAEGSINTDPYAHADDGRLYPGITNAAGIYVAGTSNGYNPGTTVRVPLNLPNGTLLNTTASVGALLIGNPAIGWTAVFDATSANGLGSTNPSSNLSINTSLNKLIGRTLPSGTVLYFTYNDQDNSNVGSYNVSIIDTTNNPTFSLASPTTVANEGDTVTFILSTTNVSTGTNLTYSITGIAQNDIESASLTGSFLIDSNGRASLTIKINADNLQEGTEVLSLYVAGLTKSISINDTSNNYTYSDGKLYLLRPPSWTGVEISLTSEAELVSFKANDSNSNRFDKFYGFQVGVDLIHLWRTDNLAGGGAIYKPAITSFKSGAGVVAPGTPTEYIIYDTSTGQLYFDQDGNGPSPTVLVGIFPDKPNLKASDFRTSKPQTYLLTSKNLTSVNEGSVATFTLTSENVQEGTYVSYLLSGIDEADLSSGNLYGNVYLDASGSASITVNLKNDFITEGPETLTVLASGVSAKTIINDTSKGAALPSYALLASSNSVPEGSNAVFTLTTTNVSSGSTIYYQILGDGITTADFGGLSLIGSSVINSLGQATLNIPLSTDATTEGDETLVIQFYTDANKTNYAGTAALVKILDISKSILAPTYEISSQYPTTFEGSVASFTFKTENVKAGTAITYVLSGIDISDTISEALTGYVIVDSSGLNKIQIPIKADGIADPNESVTLTIAGKSTSVNIIDSSPNTWSWESASGIPAKSNVIYFNAGLGSSSYRSFYFESNSELISINIDEYPKEIPTVYGFESGKDLVHLTDKDTYLYGNNFGSLFPTNNFLIGENLTTPKTSTDNVIFDTKTGILYFDIDGNGPAPTTAVFKMADGVQIKSTDIQIQQPITYSLTSISPTATAGSTVEFVLSTNVYTSTPIPYVISGLASSDVVGGNLSGTVLFGNDKKAIIKITLSPQLIISGDRAITLSAAEKSATTVIRSSSSAALPTYELVSSSSSVNEGAVASFTLTTTGVSPGTSVTYTISGVNAADVTGGLSGTATVDTNGLATISVPVSADFLTEGAETLTVTAQGKSASVSINDTSKTTLVASYALSASTNSVSEGSSAVFTLTTTNVAGGTSIPYTISGVSSADITGGAMSGTAIVSSNGNATITIPIASDLTTEGTESLTVTAQGISSSVLISDTSITPVVVTPSTTVTSIPYGEGKYFYGSSGADKVTGTSFVDVVKQTSSVSSNQLTKLADGSWQVQNKIAPSNSDNLVNVERIEFIDLSVALDLSGSAGQVAKILGSVFGPSYVSNTVFAGIGFAYLDGGMSYLDLCGLAAGAAGLTSPDALVSTLLRNATGSEPSTLSKATYLQAIANGFSYASVVQQIADSSINAQSIKLADLANTGLPYTPYIFPPTYSLSATIASVNEGSTAVFNLTTTNVAVGTEVSYILSGVSPSDLTPGTLTGKVSIGLGGAASISVPIAADGATEGQESLTISAQGATASIAINDTSKSITLPTYTLTPATLSVNEGELARVYVNTTNVAAGTALQYGVTGVSSTDVIGGLTRLVNVDSLGQA